MRRTWRTIIGCLGAVVAGMAGLATPVARAATGYNALAGIRLYDSRAYSPFTSGETRVLPIAGYLGVPVTATAVVLNVTAVSPSGGGFLTVWPSGQSRPTTSNVNFRAGDTVPNAVVVQLGASGAVNIYNFGGNTNVLVDVSGYFEGGFIGVTPTRLLDTRSGPATNSDQVVYVAGQAGVPSSVAGVMLNVTAVTPQAPGYATVHPDGTAQPNASNLNFVANEVVANAVAVGVGSNGAVRISHRSAGAAHYLVDVLGYFPSGSYVSISPTRVFDTRKGAGGRGLIRDGETYELGVAGVAGLPSAGVGAVLANITVTSPTRSGYISVWPNGAAKPSTSVLNFSANQTKPNLAVITLGNSGAVNVFVSTGSAHVLIDVLGYFPGITSTTPPAGPPLPVPTISRPGVNLWNSFRSSGRSCAAGFYSAASPMKSDDTLHTIAQNHSELMAVSQSTLGLADAIFTTSEYRGVTSNQFDWFVLSGTGPVTVTDALTYAASLSSFDFCSMIYGTYPDAAVATATSSAGRTYFTFIVNVPSFPSTFGATTTPGLLKMGDQSKRVIEMP